MLKIKKGIDLKVLNNFGFIKGVYCCPHDDDIYIAVCHSDREIYYVDDDDCLYGTRLILDKLFDLIQAGLVEKVGNE